MTRNPAGPIGRRLVGGHRGRANIERGYANITTSRGSGIWTNFHSTVRTRISNASGEAVRAAERRGRVPRTLLTEACDRTQDGGLAVSPAAALTQHPRLRDPVVRRGISRNTVEAAIRQLQAEGFVVRRAAQGGRCVPEHGARRALHGGPGAERRDRILAAARDVLPDTVRLGPTDAGIHVALHLPPGTDDTALSEEAQRCGLALPPLFAYHLGEASPGLLVNYGNVPAPDIQRGARPHPRCVPITRLEAARSETIRSRSTNC